MTATVDTVLTPSEVDQLAAYEQQIAAGLQTFVEVGRALAGVRNERLYRAGFNTFEEYCRERWNLSRPRAYELMTAAEVVSGMPDTDRPDNARQAAELARVPEPDRAEVWRETVERTDGRPTAAAIRETFERTQTPAPAPEPAAAGIDVTAAAGHPELGEVGSDGGLLGERFSLAPTSLTDHPPASGEADARLDATAGTGEREALTGVAAPVRAGDDSPAGLVDPTASLSRPGPSTTTEQDEHEHRLRSSRAVAESLVSLYMRLDPDPIRWLTRTWQPDAYRLRDMPRVRNVLTPSGLRLVAKHLDTIADHLDRTGSSL